MNTIDYLKDQFDRVQATDAATPLQPVRQKAFADFLQMGVPTVRHEEWKYTRIGSLFNKEFKLKASDAAVEFTRLPGHEDANELVFVNGKYSAGLSVLKSASLTLLTLGEAAVTHSDFVAAHFNHSSHYLRDGINALNTALTEGAIFLHVKKGKTAEHPVYIYNITDAREENVVSQPRSLVQVSEAAQLQIVETFITLGQQESFTNQVVEIVVEKEAILEYYKIQDDRQTASQVSTTHIRHTGKSYSHAVTISLDGGIVRNNTNVVMEAPHCEAHLYGLYFQKGNSHIDNHTVVDNVSPHCYSNELYKGMLDDKSTGVFNGKIFVRQPAQKTNAFQSNRNILLSDSASVNTKPQLEIFADDVKCSHGCTIGRLDEEGLFYLQSRGIPEKTAKAMLLHGFAADILEKIKCEPIRNYVDQLIAQRLEFDIA